MSSHLLTTFIELTLTKYVHQIKIFNICNIVPQNLVPPLDIILHRLPVAHLDE